MGRLTAWTSIGIDCLVLFAAGGVFSCALLTPDRDDKTRLYPGMVMVASAGKSFQQGCNDSVASPDEKPGMQSSFTYNFWMDTVEITQKAFLEMMGRNPVPDTSPYGVGDRFPVYHVTWFDAVLYCNARSRSDSLDTVYVYTGKRTLPDGRVFDLTGIRSDLSRDGYRLPTEAEWEYAAGENGITNDSQAEDLAWYAKNALNSAHAVATKQPNHLGIYDLAGNVFEWTNDWKGPYNGKAVTDPLGAPQANNEYEKVIKGGSFNYSFSYLRPSNRSATYATALSSAAEYVGFRCVRAKIGNGDYIGIERPDTVLNSITISASRQQVQTFIGTPEVKLVFVNVTGTVRTLCCVDYSRTFPITVEFTDDASVYMPVVSPDGRYVAYCSANEGQYGPSKITIRSLDSLNSPKTVLPPDSAYIPRWWIDRRTGDTCLIYTSSAVANSSALWRSNKTFVQKISGGLGVGEPLALVEDGSFHDGRSVNGRYLLSAYDRLMVRDVTTGEEWQSFVYPENGKDPGGSVQVCNASLSQDTGDSVRCLFLDFGSPQTSTITGTSYGIHEYLFTADVRGKVLGVVRCPEDEQSWDFTEWSNQPRFATGCGRDSRNQSHAIYAIDLQSAQPMMIVQGFEVQQPALWIGFLVPNPSLFALDSIGRYNEPLVISNLPSFATKLLMFWNYLDSFEVICVGSSVAIAGFDPAKITGFKAFNMSYVGGGLVGQKRFIHSYILNHCKKVKVICSSLDLGWFNQPDGDPTWGLGLGSSKGFQYDSLHAFWSSGITDDFREIIKRIPLPVPGLDTAMGQFRRDPLGWGSVPAPFYGFLDWSITNPNCQVSLSTIRNISDTLRERQIHWLMVNYPVNPYFKNDTAYSPWGPDWETALKIIQEVKALEGGNPYFHFYDANLNGNHDYGEEDACDENHLSVIGAEKLTSRLDSIIHTIVQ